MSDTTPSPVPTPAETNAVNAGIESIHAAKDVATMIALLATAVYLSTSGHGELAATALGGALTYALPSARGRQIPPVAAGIAAGLLFHFVTR